MKKILYAFILCLTTFTLGCTSTQLVAKNSNIGKSEFLEIQNIKPELENLNVTLVNNTKEVTEIIWDRSKINGSTPFLRGKYIDAGKTQPNEVITPGETVTIDIYPSSNVYFSDFGWSLTRLTYPAKLVMCIKQGAKEEFIISTIDAEEISVEQ